MGKGRGRRMKENMCAATNKTEERDRGGLRSKEKREGGKFGEKSREHSTGKRKK